ncbi:MAG TPA: CDP-glucose 4,6-dehydratase [Candidatus Ozemobacteraceae bacterium]|nr:CDP-glucose 4,6-dehydratase [Candidatus Ozemobacteraceae bacterium]
MDPMVKNRRVLVTGSTGFKGSWLSLWLLELGAEVAGFALPPERPNDLYHMLGLEPRMKQVYGDIRNPDALSTLFREFRPEIVFHLAAQPLVRLSYADPVGTYSTNVLGSIHLLEAVRHCPETRALIYITSDKCYRNREWLWGYRENDELGGHDPYSASKACAEVVFFSYLDSFFRSRKRFGAASARAGNVIGGGDWAADRLVPDCIRALQAGNPIIIRNPHSIRPWQHVLEPLSGYLLLAERLMADPETVSGAWNFGPDAEAVRTVRDLSERIVGQWGSGAIEIHSPPDAPHESKLLQLNCDKARRLLGWKPSWDFERGLSETVAWYLGVHRGENPLELAKAQIKAFGGLS